jgi:hypothetical protein
MLMFEIKMIHFPSEFPEIPLTGAVVHAKVVPTIFDVNAELTLPPEQIVELAGVAVPIGAGLTITVVFNGTLGQPFNIAVIE